MKLIRLPVVALALVAAVTMFVGMGQASAQAIAVRVGPPGPPPHYVEHRWHRPGRGAVWIAGHREWRHRRWDWIGGYWGYPPYAGGIWVPGHWARGFWHPGHWRR